MAKQVINNLESAALVRSKLNDNFSELYPLTEQAAPIISTVGYAGQKIYVGTQGYECLGFDGTNYIWIESPSVETIPIAMNAGLMDFSAKDLYNRLWIFPDGTTSTAERPAKTLDSAGIVYLKGNVKNSKIFDLRANVKTAVSDQALQHFSDLVYTLSLYTCTLTTGNISSLVNLTYYLDLSGCTLVTGDLLSLRKLTNYLDISNCTLITGDLSSLSNILNTISLSACALVTGSISSLVKLTYYLNLSGCTLVTGALSPLLMARSINLTNCTGITKENVDLSIANLVTADTQVTGAKTLVLTGLQRTAASTANVNTLITRGWAVTDATIVA